jgi:hypothetical protein
MVAGVGWRTRSWRRQLGRWLVVAGLNSAKSIAWSDLAAVWSAFKSASASDRPLDE